MVDSLFIFAHIVWGSFVFGPWFVVFFLLSNHLTRSWLLYFLLSSCSHVIVIILPLFLTVPCVVLQCVTVSLHAHTHLDQNVFIS